MPDHLPPEWRAEIRDIVLEVLLDYEYAPHHERARESPQTQLPWFQHQPYYEPEPPAPDFSFVPIR